MNKYAITLLTFLYAFSCYGQSFEVSGYVKTTGEAIPGVSVLIKETGQGSATDINGFFKIEDIQKSQVSLQLSAIGFKTLILKRNISLEGSKIGQIELKADFMALDEVVVRSGTLKEVSKLESPVPVEVFRPAFFRKNPTPNIFDALQNVNGVRPQLNCNVCNTGDIHINGLEGPYTMVLLDGMPIVSGLSTVYGLSGIPNSLVEQVEIVKGPASSLYGSEAVGGLINIITKNPSKAPKFSADAFGTTWGEYNVDLGTKFNAGEKAHSLLGINYFNFDQVIDKNNDNFTDLTLQHRISVFNKWQFDRSENRLFSMAARYYYEDRWGGETDWTPEFRGGNQIYGESIFTERKELIATYQLPTTKKLLFNASFNTHDQNSVYGDVLFNAQQNIGFAQLVWDEEIGNHSLLTGATYRYTYYDDDTPATLNANHVHLPGFFVQDEWSVNKKFKALTGLRYDYDHRHGNIWSPRIALKWSPNNQNILRLNMGTGFRVVNVFTEDHAALSGARDVIIAEELKPERTINTNLNYVKQIPIDMGFINLDVSAWYTYFNNKIIPDYETNTNQIIYDNLSGHAVSKGVSLNADATFIFPLKIMAGISFMDVSTFDENEFGEEVKERQLLTEQVTGTWSISYSFDRIGLSLDYTGNIYGPMRLPIVENDPRPDNSPWWSLQNIQVTKKIKSGLHMYGGVKNLLDFTPPDNSILGADDPFGDQFDPTYVYAPFQGTRGFIGLRYNL